MKKLMKLVAMVATLVISSSCQKDDINNLDENGADLQFLAEKLDAGVLSEADRKRVNELYYSLSFEETETLIDLRHTYYLRSGIVEADQADYLLQLRHDMNQMAFQQFNKPFHLLGFEDSEVIVQQFGSPTPGINASNVDSNARTNSSCASSFPSCTAWSNDGSIGLTETAASNRILGSYIGERTFQCSSSTYQDDCDYVFSFSYDKIYAQSSLLTPNPVLLSGTAAYKLTDSNPASNDCGVYTTEIMLGKTRVDFDYGSPQTAASTIQLNLVNSIQTGWCFVGTWGSEQWWYGGVYYPQWDGWGANNPQGGYQPCDCNPDGKWVR